MHPEQDPQTRPGAPPFEKHDVRRLARAARRN